MKHVLIVTYYWPPAGGVEVHRVLSFCKYLTEFGWTPHVLTVRDGGTASASDPALVDAVRHVESRGAPSWEPHALYRRLTGRKGAAHDNGPASARGWGEFVRLNCFIPDARIGWYPGAVAEGRRWIREARPDLIFSSAPPYTVHLVADRLRREFHLPWVADFRDPWVENYAYNTTYRFPWVVAANRWLEKKVLRRANRVITATPGQRLLQGSKIPGGLEKTETITNGYDLETPPVTRTANSGKFLLSYYGSLSGQRLPAALLQALDRLLADTEGFRRDFTFRVVGRATAEARERIVSAIPSDNLDLRPMIPHADYLREVADTQVLLVLVDAVPRNEIIIPAKCFELMTTGNPLLALGPPGGDADSLLRKENAGVALSPADATAIHDALLGQYQAWKRGNLRRDPFLPPLLHRRALTGDLARVFDLLTPPRA